MDDESFHASLSEMKSMLMLALRVWVQVKSDCMKLRVNKACVEHAWKMHGTRMEDAWNTHGRCMEHAWKMHGTRMEDAWNTHGRCMEHA